jgi:hypothetical protein
MQRFRNRDERQKNIYKNIYTNDSDYNKELIEMLKKINIFSTIVIVIIGLIGHFITVNVYARKHNRTNAITVYLLCLAVNDSLFLIVHFFEDTLRSLNNFSLYSKSEQTDLYTKIISVLRFADKFNPPCQIINYLR